MEKLATEESVWSTCDQVEMEGRKVSGRTVQIEIGGSLTTILRYIRTWKAKKVALTVATSELPEDVQKSIAVVLEKKVQQATAALLIELAEVAEREKEVMEALGESENRIIELENDLSNTHDNFTALQQARDKEAAVVVERIAGLGEQINRLAQERNDSAHCADKSKVELVTAQVHLEHTLQRAVGAEDKFAALEQQVAALILSKTETEKELAVSVLHAENLSVQITTLAKQLKSAGDKLVGTDALIVDLTIDLKDALAKQGKAEAIVEQISMRLQESAITVEQLRNENTAARKEASAFISDLFALHINDYAIVNVLRQMMTLESVEKDTADAVAEQAEVSTTPQGKMDIEELRKRMKSVTMGKAKVSVPPTQGIVSTTS